MTQVKRRFVYHMWVPDNIADNQKNVIKCHIFCMKRYVEWFDDVIIVLAYDNNIEAANKLKKIFIDVFNKDDQSLTFKTVKNTEFREASTAYQYLYSMNDMYNGITFFGHSKGLNNIIQDSLKNKTSCFSTFENISEWICALYYFSLNFKEETAKALCGTKCYYGPLLVYTLSNNAWIYSGAFYWVNQENLFNTCKNIYCTSKFLKQSSKTTAETMPNNLILNLNFYYITSHNNFYIPINPGNEIDFYKNVDFAVKQCSGSEEDYNNFIDFYNSILEEIKIYDLDI